MPACRLTYCMKFNLQGDIHTCAIYHYHSCDYLPLQVFLVEFHGSLEGAFFTFFRLRVVLITALNAIEDTSDTNTYYVALDGKSMGAAFPVRSLVPRSKFSASHHLIGLGLRLGWERRVDLAAVDE